MFQIPSGVKSVSSGDDYPLQTMGGGFARSWID